MRITRIFHPIGQGGFFTEHHEFSSDEQFTIVYDCGVAHNRKSADNVVQQPRLEGIDIDILFISHFDYDHVCKLAVLLDHVGQIKNVVMPLLHDEEKTFLTNLFRLSGFDILTLINDPNRFFGSTTKIFRVASVNNNEVIDGTADELPISLDTHSPSVPLRSGIRISIPINSASPGHDWMFTPYNHKSNTNRHLLETELKAKGFDIHRLRTDPRYTIDNAIISRRDLKGIYNALPGGINLNSMLMYSGPEYHHSKLRLRFSVQNSFEIFCQHKLACPINTFCHPNAIWPLCFHPVINPSTRHFCCFVYEDEFRNTFNAPGCIYTGDTDLNTLKLHDVFKHVWKHVGTLQIPHHGAVSCFDSTVLNYQKMICPIAVGSNFHKSYGHPAISVINTIIQKSCIPAFVTEKNTAFVQTIF